jgi:hypothetical protein
MQRKNSTHGLVKIFRPNKKTGSLELVDRVDPFKELTPVSNPCRNYKYKYRTVLKGG